jgi:hypothetical protein
MRTTQKTTNKIAKAKFVTAWSATTISRVGD